MNISSNKDFEKDYKKLPDKVQKRFKERILLFREDPFDPILNNHALKGKYSGYRSINVTGDLRAIFKIAGKDVIFAALDSHSNLYG